MRAAGFYNHKTENEGGKEEMSDQSRAVKSRHSKELGW